MENVFTKKDPLLDVINQVVLGEKKLTDAELKKREEIAQAIERENPGMDMGKKMAIATAQAKKVAEEAEQIDEADEREVSDKLKRARDYEKMSSVEKVNSAPLEDRIRWKKYANLAKAKKLRKEEVEQIDEISKKTLGNYIGKAVVDVHNDAKWAGESGSKDASNKAYKRLLGVKSAAARLSKQNVSGGRISNYRSEEAEQIEEDNNNDLGDTHDDAYEAAKKVGIKPHSIGKHPKHPHLIRVAGENGKGVYNRKTKTFHKGIDEEVEQIDEISAELATKVQKAHAAKGIRYASTGNKSKSAEHIARAIHASIYAEKRKANPKAPINVSSKEMEHKANKLGLKTEEVNLEEQLENFWGAYLTCLDEAKDDASQQALLLRAMAKDPSDLMKMKRAIAMGDKALTNPVMRQEILKMLDQMMNLTVTDKALLQKTRSSFMKQKQFKAADTTNTEEYVPEEVEELDEANIPVHHVNKAVSKVLGTKGAVRFAMHHRPGTDKHTSWDKVNSALMKQGVKTKHIADIAAHLKPAQYNEEVEELDERNKENALRRKMMDASRGARWKVQNKMTADDVRDWDGKHKTNQAQNKAIGRALRNEEVEELDELSKDTLGNYIKKAATGMNGMAVHAHMSGSASSAEQREKHFDKAFKRGAGIKKAVDKLTKEEVEELDEISKKTLGSYIKKANADANDNAVRASWETSRIAVGNPNDPGSHNKANKYIRDLRNRKKGISRATDKLTKEEAEKAPFEGGREVKSSKPAAERVKKIAKGMQKKYTKKD